MEASTYTPAGAARTYASLSRTGAKESPSTWNSVAGLQDDGGQWDVYFDTARYGDAWALSNDKRIPMAIEDARLLKADAISPCGSGESRKRGMSHELARRSPFQPRVVNFLPPQIEK